MSIQSKNKVIKPLISLVVPALNEENLLGKHLDLLSKAVKTTGINAEIIVCDGGSKDKTLEIAKQYANKVVEQDGVFNTIAEGRNKGASLASGEIIVFINADTYPREPENFLISLQKFARSNSSTVGLGVFVHGDASIDGRPVINAFDRFFHFATNWYFWAATLSGASMARGECQIVRKDIFKAIGGYRGDLVAGEDVDLFRRLRKKGRLRIEKKIIVVESSRRFLTEGYFSTMFRWFMNDISVRLRGKAYSKEWSRTNSYPESNL